ncbi:MAG: hypothetical protein ACXAD7_00500 [Candidatus Kariarchaeaceae archaeon]|jgi:hypothetical protein
MSIERTEEEKSIFQQIEKTSVNLTLFSIVESKYNVKLSIPRIIGGDDIITDELIKFKVEESLSQLNIMDVFDFKEYILQSCFYESFQLGIMTKGRFTPNMYLLISQTNNAYLLNLLLITYPDLNLDGFFKKVEFMSKSFSGVFRRVSKQVEENIINTEEVDKFYKNNIDNLSLFLYYQIFEEQSLTEIAEEPVIRGSSMVVGMFVELLVRHTEYQCMGRCEQTFTHDDRMFEGIAEILCPTCESLLTFAPPIVKPETIRFIYPKGASRILLEDDKNGANPLKFLSYLTLSLVPRNITLAINRLSSSHFSNLVGVPTKAIFQSSTNPNEQISLNTQWKVKRDKIFLFCSIGNSLYSNRSDTSFIPHLTSITINRQIVEGIDKGKNFEAIIRGTTISDWILTDTMLVEDIENYSTLDNLPNGGISS